MSPPYGDSGGQEVVRTKRRRTKVHRGRRNRVAARLLHTRTRIGAAAAGGLSTTNEANSRGGGGGDPDTYARTNADPNSDGRVGPQRNRSRRRRRRRRRFGGERGDEDCFVSFRFLPISAPVFRRRRPGKLTKKEKNGVVRVCVFFSVTTKRRFSSSSSSYAVGPDKISLSSGVFGRGGARGEGGRRSTCFKKSIDGTGWSRKTA